ncbi:MAG TPA: acetyltransferase, partial [Rhodocyclaceae bacterium]|nr:acetyltransferase [Rhodocyclaceae bacterium]
MKDIVIFGAGGHGREIHQLIEDINVRSAQWNFLGFLDGDHAKHGSKLHGFPVLGDESWLERNSACHVVVAVGGVPARWRVV